MSKFSIPEEEVLNGDPKRVRKKAILLVAEYLKKYNLDPEKNWDKDPVHGKKLGKLYQVIRICEEKIKHKMATLIKPEVHPKVREVKNDNIYDYPDVDGQPMSAQMKKKYRTKMRALKKANMDSKKAEAIALQFAQKWNNSDHPEERVLRKKSPKTGQEANVPLKTKRRVVNK